MFAEKKGIKYFIENKETHQWLCFYQKYEYQGSDFSGKNLRYDWVPKLDGLSEDGVTGDPHKACCFYSFDESELWRLKLYDNDKYITTEHEFA